MFIMWRFPKSWGYHNRDGLFHGKSWGYHQPLGNPKGAKNGQYPIHGDFNDECWWDDHN